MGSKIIGVDLRCLPADGSAGGGIAHAARAIAAELEQRLGTRLIRYDVHGNRHALIRAIKERPCDLLFVPSGAVSPGLPVPAIPWVHDLDIFDHPEWFPQSWVKRTLTTHFFLQGIRRAPHVFAVSEYTKQAMIRHARIPAHRVTVTSEGGDDVLASIPRDQLAERKREAVQRLASLGITRRFALVLGTLEPRKNIAMLCRVWPEVVRQVPDVDLVIAGQDGWKTMAIHEAIRACPSTILLQKPHHNGRTPFTESDRRDLLLAASLVCVPSFSEGFGLVALEATQAGTPVLASRRGALPEVLGEGSWLLEPEDREGWREKVTQVLSDGALSRTMIDQQAARNASFSWRQTAHHILEVLDEKHNLPYHPHKV
ncbi:MAG: hypothetical protein RL141_342 [Candidatus Parcubacteria bacterium]|jgi:glycosyltransferase involved in cell wall biosynthesis